MPKPLILIINGSPRNNSNTMVLANRAKKAIEKLDGRVITENLSKKKIKHCLGCWSTNNKLCKYPCRVEDDLNDVFKRMIEADGIIFVSGVYWFGITGLLKLLIDRMTCLWNNGAKKPLLDNKVVAFMSSGAEEGNVSAMAPLIAASTFWGMHILPYGLIYSNARNKTGIEKSWGPDFAERCGHNMIVMINTLKKNKTNWWNGIQKK